MKIRQRLFMVLGVLFAAGMAFWLSDIDSRRTTLPQLDVSQPMYYMNSFSLSAYDAAGLMQHQLSANRLAYYVDQRALLDKPNLVVYDKVSRWDVGANKGLYNSDHQIELKDGVHVVQTPEPNRHDGVVVDTQNLTIDLAAGLAETESPVRLVTQRGWVEAQAMQLWFNERQLFLHDRVRGYYHVQ